VSYSCLIGERPICALRHKEAVQSAVCGQILEEISWCRDDQTKRQ